MKRFVPILAAAALAAATLAPPASAEFGIEAADVTFSAADGSAATQAGSHPFSMSTEISFKTREAAGVPYELPFEDAKDLTSVQVPGLVGKPTAVPACTSVEFLSRLPDDGCSPNSQVGVNDATIIQPGDVSRSPLYSLVPPPGVAMRLGLVVEGLPVVIDLGVQQTPPYRTVAFLRDTYNALPFYGAKLTLWGVPAAAAHDAERAGPGCAGGCPASLAEEPFLTLPRACAGPLETNFEIDSWQHPGAWASQGVLTHDESTPPSPRGLAGCEKLAFAPSIDAQPTAEAAESPSGLDFSLDIADEGLTSPTGLADSDLKSAEVTLPEGMTINPSQAEGLGVCSKAQLAGEKADSEPGEGCPPASKIGTVQVETPLLPGHILTGALFVAEPYANPFGSLIALYMTIKDPKLGIAVSLAGKVEPDPRTGQLITTFGDPGAADPAFRDLPQLPFSHFRLHFREGGRSPLITPPACGTYTTEARFTPWANPDSPYATTSTFHVARGVGGGPCPPAGAAPFEPGFSAGTLNNSAGAHSPFAMRLTRRDGDQDLTKFSATLPPGLVAKLAGTTMCPEAAIAAAKAKTGKEELASPSCPSSSQIGTVLAGAGVGSELTYVPGKVYFAGPYNGAPLSVVGVVPAVAGPFDVGTVVTRQALQVNPRSGIVTVDGKASDPIPHILAGIPLRVRDIRVLVDRPDFTLNPTSCDASQIAAQLWGGGTDVFSALDDSPVSRAERFQAAGCASLGFAPSLALTLRGGTKRGDHPALNGVYRPRPGDANLKRLVLRLPHSAFLDQAHIRTICTRVQFAAKACPPAAAYGWARAVTPILDQPLEGPVYLRSSDHNLPDFVAALHGLVDVEAVARIDSVNGGIRATFEDVPDAPLSEVVVQMQGAKKGLIVNSANLCAAKHRAGAQMTGQNGKAHDAKPLMRAAECGREHGAGHKHHRRRTAIGLG